MKFNKPARTVSRVFLHCSASDNAKHDSVSVIKKWHIKRGFSDVGYHFFIQRDGNIQLGRPLSRTPAAQRRHNKGTIAICLHGLTIFTAAQQAALQNLCAQIDSAYNVISFHGHKEVSNKSCPVFDYKDWLNLNPNGFILPPEKATAWERFLNWLKK